MEKRLAAVFSNGFEEIELLSVVDVLRRANVNIDLVSIEDMINIGSHNIKISADKMFNYDDILTYDGLFLPGGMPGTNKLKEHIELKKALIVMNAQNKLISAVCAAPIVLENAQIVKGKKITSFPSFKEVFKNSIYLEEPVVLDSNILTSRGAGTSMLLAFEILKFLGLKEESDKLKEEMQFNELFKDRGKCNG